MKPTEYFDFSSKEALTHSVMNAPLEVRKHLGRQRYEAIREMYTALLDAESSPELPVDQRAALRDARPKHLIVITYTLVAAAVQKDGVVAYLRRYPQLLPSREASN